MGDYAPGAIEVSQGAYVTEGETNDTVVKGRDSKRRVPEGVSSTCNVMRIFNVG